jgi:replicative DNA helicase
MTTQSSRSHGFQSLSSILESSFGLGEGGGLSRPGKELAAPDRSISGIPGLPAMTAGHLVVVGGRPKVGKTRFALSLAEHVAKRQGRSVGLFAAEGAVREGGGAFLFTEAVRQLDVDRLAEDAGRARDRGRLDLLVVDNAQLLRDPHRAWEDPEEEFAAVVRSLKHLARRLEIPILVVSRAVDRGWRQAPERDDLPEALVQHADLILLVHRPENAPGGVPDILIAKNRLGSEGAVFKSPFVENVLAFRNPTRRAA